MMLRWILLLVALSALVDKMDSALPGARMGAAVWYLPGSYAYIYGGTGFGSDSTQQGHLNDLWGYDFVSNSWTLLSGGPDLFVAPVFGDGNSSDTNTPGGLVSPCAFPTDYGLWLFGGLLTTDQYSSDLWLFQFSDNRWKWMAGTQQINRPGVYEDYGSATSETAAPGGRYSAACFTDPTQARFGMFGGRGIAQIPGLLSDLWAYTPDQDKWGWISGNSDADATTTAVKGKSSATEFPSGMFNAGSWIFQAVGETFLFLGFGSVTGSESSDELWRFSTLSGEWTLLKANEDWSKSITNRTGVAMWGNAGDGSCYIFGGQGYDSRGNLGYLGDLHYYDADRNAYTLVGDEPSERGGVYGEKGVASQDNYPGSRAFAATWADQSGNLWLFGGIGLDSVRETGLLNDVWKFDVNNGQWTWVGGSQFANTPGNYDPKATEPGVQLSPDAPAAKSPGDVETPSSSVGNVPVEPGSGLTREQIVAIGVGIGVGGPLVAGAIVLAVLLQKRKANKKGKTEKTSDNAPGAHQNPTNPEQGNYNFIPSMNAAANVNTNYGKIDAVAPDNTTVNADAKIGGSDNRFIPYSSVTLEREIGVGSYGKVYLGKLRTTKVAVKVANTKISQEEFIREANFQLSIPPHPNIVQLLGISIDGPEPLVVLEYCNEGSLDKLLFETEKNWTPAEQINLAAAIARGLDHLHQNNIAHRDLAVRNILLHHNEPKISDFGMSRKLKEVSQVGKTATNIGPIRWMAPEALGKQTYSTKSDVWTFGILLYEIVARQEPHADEDLINVAVKIRDAAYTPLIPDDCPELLRDVMQLCWKSDPAERPDMSLLCEMLDLK